jgi:Cu/Zn superoxide dismutase
MLLSSGKALIVHAKMDDIIEGAKMMGQKKERLLI